MKTLTVGSYNPTDARGFYYEPRPFIRLRGKWLEEIGFETGTKIRVVRQQLEDGKIVLVLEKAER